MIESHLVQSIQSECSNCDYCQQWSLFVYKLLTSPHVSESRYAMARDYTVKTVHSNITTKECASEKLNEWVDKMDNLTVDELVTSCNKWIKLPNPYASLSELFEPIEFQIDHSPNLSRQACNHILKALPDKVDKERVDLNDRLYSSTQAVLSNLADELDQVWQPIYEFLNDLAKFESTRVELLQKSCQIQERSSLDDTKATVDFFLTELVAHLHRIDDYTTDIHAFHMNVLQELQKEDCANIPIRPHIKVDIKKDDILLSIQNFIDKVLVSDQETLDNIYKDIFVNFISVATEALDPQDLVAHNILIYLQTLMVTCETKETEVIRAIVNEFTDSNQDLVLDRNDLLDQFKEGALSAQAVLKQVVPQQQEQEPHHDLIHFDSTASEASFHDAPDSYETPQTNKSLIDMDHFEHHAQPEQLEESEQLTADEQLPPIRVEDPPEKDEQLEENKQSEENDHIPSPNTDKDKVVKWILPSSPVELEQEYAQVERSPPLPLVPEEQEETQTGVPPSVVPEEANEQVKWTPEVVEKRDSPPPSVVPEQDNHQGERNPSPSVVSEQDKEFKRSASPSIESKRSPTPSVVPEQDEQAKRSPSPSVVPDQDKEVKPHPSVISDQDTEVKRKPSPSVVPEQDEQTTSRRPSLPPQDEDEWNTFKPKGRWSNLRTSRYEKQPMRDNDDWESRKPDVLKGGSLTYTASSAVVSVKKSEAPPGLVPNQFSFSYDNDQYQEPLLDNLEKISPDLLASIVRHLHRQNDSLIQTSLQLKEEMLMLKSQYCEVIRCHREQQAETFDTYEKKRNDDMATIKKYVEYLEYELKKRTRR